MNRAKRYAALRQVYYSLILARWFKDNYRDGSFKENLTLKEPSLHLKLIDSHDLTNLTSKESWDKITYFSQYKDSFNKGEYNLSETVRTPTGQVIRRYVSGGMEFTSSAIVTGLYQTADKKNPSGVNVVSFQLSIQWQSFCCSRRLGADDTKVARF
ncbi:MAG TPA: hypothetical protein VJA84_01915 [Candidatus Omnitrophota bacterium]|nr:hypothetical protein [Candidatus Omnitrophota bacterium]